MPIIVFNEIYPGFQLKNKTKVKAWILEVISKHGKSCKELQFFFCDDEFLLALNQEYLKHNTFTDIITFNYNQGNTISGEIYISIDRVIENATNYEKSFINELCRVIIHGILHLLGFNDITEDEQQYIKQKEDSMLELLPISSFM
ncbi:MAG: rRNA maturation RNase YbeY [Bacteroidetes bacterium]|nr:rRNA maturation RNase YbeY [Bacteroidota bacterium]MBP7399047.1 rRNA maturation RNase YbeY [Chitinophagales bacterium]MBK7108274.1 rRNA maturation RNase YbeY [Bacteroidota bacterium]MBK8486302.1 rRNA maturation RNase YbeY [Bacteroidota bacterium]MBK8683084.1 rRNA maturation RNase YbeY [Bacteroidota bacterium]